MFQVVFNKLSAAEMAALPKDLQLELLAEFQFLPQDLDKLDAEHFGRVKRDGKVLHRYRSKDYRIYFSPHPQGIEVHRVLHKNTIRDFLFRSNLPMAEEDEALAEHGGFWELIHEGQGSK
jgi:mRNA-degrading endonuclease RelE of RelBE toxin-antitoxin system